MYHFETYVATFFNHILLPPQSYPIFPKTTRSCAHRKNEKTAKERIAQREGPHQIRTKFAPNSDQTQLLPFNNRVWYEPYANEVRLNAGAESATIERLPFAAYICSTYIDVAHPHRHNDTWYTDTPPNPTHIFHPTPCAFPIKFSFSCNIAFCIAVVMR